MWDGTELELLRAIRGPLYARRRDQALASRQNFAEVVAQARTQADERLLLTAIFLAGWEQDRERYAAFERSLDAIDLVAEGRKITGIAPALGAAAHAALEEHGERLLPYCWEQVIKLGEGLLDWKRMAYFDVIARSAAAASIEPMLWCVDETTDAETLDGAYQTLLVLPYLGLKDRLTRGKFLHASRVFVYEDLLQRIRLAGKKKR